MGRRINHLPVVDDRSVSSVLSDRDVLRASTGIASPTS
jgi:signal-transduction protein with cAMP-binding, CBS, and nucleotidyltransferase domain